MGRPKEHDEAMRVALLRAAEELVNVHGPGALSVRAVAEATETTTRAVYSVFGSKSGLLEALAARLFEHLGDAIDRTRQTNDVVTDVVEASMHGFRRVALEHPSLYNLVFLRVVPDLVLGDKFEEIAAKTFDRLKSLLDRVAAKKEMSVSATEAARMVHALTEGLASMELRGALGPSERAELVWRTALSTLLRGIVR